MIETKFLLLSFIVPIFTLSSSKDQDANRIRCSDLLDNIQGNGTIVFDSNCRQNLKTPGLRINNCLMKCIPQKFEGLATDVLEMRCRNGVWKVGREKQILNFKITCNDPLKANTETLSREDRIEALDIPDQTRNLTPNQPFRVKGIYRVDEECATKLLNSENLQECKVSCLLGNFKGNLPQIIRLNFRKDGVYIFGDKLDFELICTDILEGSGLGLKIYEPNGTQQCGKFYGSNSEIFYSLENGIEILYEWCIFSNKSDMKFFNIYYCQDGEWVLKHNKRNSMWCIQGNNSIRNIPKIHGNGQIDCLHENITRCKIICPFGELDGFSRSSLWIGYIQGNWLQLKNKNIIDKRLTCSVKKSCRVLNVTGNYTANKKYCVYRGKLDLVDHRKSCNYKCNDGVFAGQSYSEQNLKCIDGDWFNTKNEVFTGDLRCIKRGIHSSSQKHKSTFHIFHFLRHSRE